MVRPAPPTSVVRRPRQRQRLRAGAIPRQPDVSTTGRLDGDFAHGDPVLAGGTATTGANIGTQCDGSLAGAQLHRGSPDGPARRDLECKRGERQYQGVLTGEYWLTRPAGSLQEVRVMSSTAGTVAATASTTVVRSLGVDDHRGRLRPPLGDPQPVRACLRNEVFLHSGGQAFPR